MERVHVAIMDLVQKQHHKGTGRAVPPSPPFLAKIDFLIRSTCMSKCKNWVEGPLASF